MLKINNLTKVIGYLLLTFGYGGYIITNNELYKYLVLLSIPIFCFHVVKGIDKSKDIGKYKLRIWIMALIVQIFYTLALDTYQFNGMFGLWASVMLIDYINKGEWYWLHTFVIVSMLLPVEYGLITVCLTTLYYISKHNDLIKGKRKIYYIINLAIPLAVYNPVHYIIVLILIIIIDRMDIVKDIKKREKIHYYLLLLCYLILATLRFVVLSYK